MILIIAFGIILGIVGWKFLKWSIKTLFWIMVACLVISAAERYWLVVASVAFVGCIGMAVYLNNRQHKKA